MTHYRKLIVAVVGILLMLVHKHLGVDLGAVEPALVDGVIAGLTALGVWAVPNEEA